MSELFKIEEEIKFKVRIHNSLTNTHIYFNSKEEALNFCKLKKEKWFIAETNPSKITEVIGFYYNKLFYHKCSYGYSLNYLMQNAFKTKKEAKFYINTYHQNQANKCLSRKL